MPLRKLIYAYIGDLRNGVAQLVRQRTRQRNDPDLIPERDKRHLFSETSNPAFVNRPVSCSMRKGTLPSGNKAAGLRD